MICPKCLGSGTKDLFTSSEPCEVCRASGEVTALHQLPQPSPLRITLKNGGRVDAIFLRLDGMYSCCCLAGNPYRVFHLSRNTPMWERNGRWEIVD